MQIRPHPAPSAGQGEGEHLFYHCQGEQGIDPVPASTPMGRVEGNCVPLAGPQDRRQGLGFYSRLQLDECHSGSPTSLCASVSWEPCAWWG